MVSEYTARNATSLKKLVAEHKIQPKPFSDELLESLKKLSDQVVGDLAAKDPLSQEVYDSIISFRKDVGAWHNISEKAFLTVRG